MDVVTPSRRATAGPAARPLPVAVCPACHAGFDRVGGVVPIHCPRCGHKLEDGGGERLHRFACATPECPGRRTYGVGWLPDLARGCVWTCWSCGVRQVARVPLGDSRYLGFTEEDHPEREGPAD